MIFAAMFTIILSPRVISCISRTLSIVYAEGETAERKTNRKSEKKKKLIE